METSNFKTTDQLQGADYYRERLAQLRPPTTAREHMLVELYEQLLEKHTESELRRHPD